MEKGIHQKGIKTNNSKRDVCADGYKLPPMVVYKEQSEKQIMREMQQYPKDALYQVQKNAWCDEWCMLFRVEKMLKQFVKKAPEGIVPYLRLDKYKCHIKEVLQRP